MYTTSSGKFVQVNALQDVPPEYLAKATCIEEKAHTPPKERPSKQASSPGLELDPSAQLLRALEQQLKLQKPATAHESGGGSLARPDQIELEGNIRRESISSPIGRIELRWPRSVESLFGRTPLRAMTDAARTVSRAISTAAFPSNVQKLSVDWKVVFMDEHMPERQIPAYLIQNCHPGWMTPPGNIYIVAERVAGGCGGQPRRPSVADGDLAEVLVHELGHAVEYHILGSQFHRNRMRAEGFATWFEMYAASYSSMINRSEIIRRTQDLAAMSFKLQPKSFTFSGDASSYARAAMYFLAISEKRGVRGIMEVYQRMSSDNLDFFPAVEKVIYWDTTQLEREAARAAKAG
jgi:hypothetical protein